MAAQPSPSPAARPRVPAHAWTWLQRSRPVLTEVASQLYGSTEGHVLDRLKADYAEDPFVQDLVARVVCDVAFNGRVPERRPAGARWDRGLTWWAAHLAGVGISRQRQAIMEGLRESVNAFKSEVKGVEAKTVMDLMIVTQYFDMMKDVGSSSKTTAVFQQSAGDGSSAVAKGFMSGLPAAPGFAQPMGR